MSNTATKFSAKVEADAVHFSYMDDASNVVDTEIVPISSNQFWQLQHQMIWCDTLPTKHGMKIEELERKEGGLLRSGKIWQ